MPELTVPEPPLVLKHVPLMAKQPAERLMPLANVEVEKLETVRAFSVVVPAERNPEKVEVELVPKTERKPCRVLVPVVLPCKVEGAVDPA